MILVYIEFKDRKLRKNCNDFDLAKREWGEKIARKLIQRLNEIYAAENLENLNCLPPTRCHPLKGDRAGQFAVDLVHPFRLIFTPVKTELRHEDVDKSLIDRVRILGVENYHDK